MRRYWVNPRAPVHVGLRTRFFRDHVMDVALKKEFIPLSAACAVPAGAMDGRYWNSGVTTVNV